MCVDEVRVLDGDVQTLFTKSESRSGEFRLSLDDCTWALNVLKARRAENCVLCEQ